ncbi:transcription factor with AP2 domain(s) [Plasmodium reichenowi]|uniref:Transcription factor with AP2 domain(S) n=1 Tax=Plasmodium reichenowi TaxID=5854 RepID=A0A151L6C5_PLARE|nr:transcription factor with AP2 domain(s) [Plasmodium reichenowi]KYN94493.1 transcription factor with AP2 domain(s) [Plasmodium reichenowi]
MIFRYYTKLYKHQCAYKNILYNKYHIEKKLQYFYDSIKKNNYSTLYGIKKNDLLNIKKNSGEFLLLSDIFMIKQNNLFLLNNVRRNFYYNTNIIKRIYKDSLFYYDKKYFSGRSGGLKRKKKRKEERIVNTGSAKRLEFFYPKKKRRQRIGLIQNSRKNIVYDNIFKRFLVYHYKQGIQVFRSFSCKKKRNFEAARNKAIILSNQYNKRFNKHNMNDQQTKDTKNIPLNVMDSNLIAKYNNELIKQIKIIPDKNKSGYRGVFYEPSYHAYICTYNEAGVRKFQIFKIQNNDYLEAYHLALMCRRYKLFKNYQFVFQRNRIRSGRIPLK